MFAELLTRSCFSFLHGAAQPEEMVEAAHAQGLHALALCDRDGLYGSVRAHVRAEELGQRYMVGAELGLSLPNEIIERSDVPRDRDPARERGRERNRDPARDRGRERNREKGTWVERPVIVLLVENHAGYANLCRLLTLAHAGLPKGEAVLELEWLREHNEGLIVIVPAPEMPGGAAEPEDALFECLVECFRGRAYVGAFRRLDSLDGARMACVEAWSETYDLPVVASARPLFHERARKPLADVMHCIRHTTTLDKAGTALRSNAAAILCTEKQIRRLFKDRPEWVDRTVEVADRAKFSLKEVSYKFPCTLEPGETPDTRLRRLTFEGAARRYPEGVPEQVEALIEKELVLIAKLEAAPYFLSTWEVVEIARRRHILCQGRGSAANSAVCFVLGITAVDPARSKLLFERFMSEERAEPPDIDIDFEHERREEVIQEIYERHGRERAAMVSEIICYRGKSALREVGKAFGLSLEQVDRLSSLASGWVSLKDAATASPDQLTEIGFDAGDERLQKMLTVARQLEGMPRHLSIHVGGFVLSAEPLYAVAPIEPARMEGRTVIPWDKDDIEALGFFKVDVLGLGMLTAIRKCLELIAEPTLGAMDASTREERFRDFDPIEELARIPPEDPAVYEMISRADTVGVFQIESRAQMSMLPRLRPERFYDLVIEVAIVRPGPIQGGMVHPFLRRRNGEEPVVTPHPDLWPILERTLGVPLFQEQVMQISIVGAGYTGGQADQLRRDMAAWKKSGRLLRHRERLLEGFAKKGISAAFGEALFEQIKGFGDYGFPESHAASFALLVYSSSWQKRHYPAHFTCALLNAQPMGFYSASSLVRDAQKHGVEVRDVCVVSSNWDCTLEALDAPNGNGNRSGGEAGAPRSTRQTHALRLGFRQIKGIGSATGERIEEARREEPFRELDDLVRRARLRKGEVEALAEAGALERVVKGRRQALWEAKAPRVGGLFDGLRVEEPTVHLPSLSAPEQLVLDYGRKGLSVKDHPVRHLRKRLNHVGAVTTIALEKVAQGSVVSVAGLVLSRQRPSTASGVVFITLEDETGIANLVLYDRVFEKYRMAARHGGTLLVRGKVERYVTPPVPGATSAIASKPSAPIIHVIVESLERLDVPGRSQGLKTRSRDFH